MKKHRTYRVAAATMAAICLLSSVGCAQKPENTPEKSKEEPMVTTSQPTESTTKATTKPALIQNGSVDIDRVIFAADELVPIKDHIPDVEVELRYATPNNFTGKVIYDFDEAYLRYGTVEKLKGVQEALKEEGYRLLIWDAYRPHEAQFVLWDVVPDPRYVANPNGGYSNHSNGGTLDISMVTTEGEAVEMPSEFDEFDSIADRDYSTNTEAARTNALLLEGIMVNAGFSPYFSEWWHYSDTNTYAFEDLKTIRIPTAEQRTVTLSSDVSVQVAAIPNGEVIATAKAGETVYIVGYVGQYTHIMCESGHGYVLNESLS